jgi:hypothetical protein
LPPDRTAPARPSRRPTDGPGLGRSPDFNPIENAFAKLKAFLRKLAARTRNTLWTAVADAFSSTECANYFTAAGYEPE